MNSYHQYLIYIAPASFAQARIWLDEQIRFHPEKPLVAIYNMPFVYRLSQQYTLSIQTTSSSSATACHKTPITSNISYLRCRKESTHATYHRFQR